MSAPPNGRPQTGQAEPYRITLPDSLRQQQRPPANYARTVMADMSRNTTGHVEFLCVEERFSRHLFDLVRGSMVFSEVRWGVPTPLPPAPFTLFLTPEEGKAFMDARRATFNAPSFLVKLRWALHKELIPRTDESSDGSGGPPLNGCQAHLYQLAGGKTKCDGGDVPAPLMSQNSSQALTQARLAAVRRAFAIAATPNPFLSNNSALAPHVIPPPPGLGPGGDAGGGATGGRGGSMHHPGPTRPSQSPQSQQQQQQQQQAPSLTSTPPGIQSQQQHTDINKQVSPHMQGQQVQPGSAHTPMMIPSYMSQVQSHTRAMLQQQQHLNNKLAAGFRPLTPPANMTNMTPQQIAFAQAAGHPHFQNSNIISAQTGVGVYSAQHHMHQQYTPQGRGNNPNVHLYPPPPSLPYLQSQMMTSFGHNQPPSMYFTNPIQMMRPNMSMQQPQQNTGHIGSPAPPQAQSQSSGLPGMSTGTPGPPMQQEKKRRSHAIPIVNPETGKDLLDELCSESSSNSAAATPPRSGESSARQTPQPAMGTPENNIAAEFAAKVAIAAGEDSKNARMGIAASDGGRMPVSVMMMPGQVNGPSPGLDSEPSMSTELQKQAALPHQTKDTLASVNCKTSETWKNKSKATFAVPSTPTDLDSQIERNRSKPAKAGYAAVTDTHISSDNVNTKKVEKSSSVNQVKVFDASTPKEGDTAKTSGSTVYRVCSPPQSMSPIVGSPGMFCQMLPGTPNSGSSINYNYSGGSSQDKDSPLLMMPETPPSLVMQDSSPQMANLALMCSQTLEGLPSPPDTDSSNGEFDSDGKGANWRTMKNRKSNVEVVRKGARDQQPRDMLAKRVADKEVLESEPTMEVLLPTQESSYHRTPPLVSTPDSLDSPDPLNNTAPALSSSSTLSPMSPEFIDYKDSPTGTPVHSQEKFESPAATTPLDNPEDNVSAEEKLVSARNEENSRASVDVAAVPSPTTSVSPTSTEKPAETSKPLVYYNKDQWSPSNQEGKKKYERDFLLQLKNDPQSMKRPDDLPKLEVVINDPYKNRSNDPRPLGNLNRGSSNADSLLMPKFMNQPTNRNSLTKRNSQQGKVKEKKVIHLNLSLNEEVKLNETENAWRPTRLVKPDEVDPSHEDLYKKVRSVLNKLTPEKFDLLVDKVRALPIDTKEKLEGVINLVFEKAVDEPSFSVAYAMMCQTLSGMQVSVNKNKETKDVKSNSEILQFKKILLIRCQTEFEKQSDSKDNLRREERLKEIEAVDGEKRKELEMQLEEEDRRIRMKYVGVNRFIGELYKRHMLTGNIMVQCITKLLEASDEESLECLCKLLTTIGKELETRAEKDKKPVDLSQHFQRMQSIVDARKTSSRIRFMLQDVIELRADKWRPRRGDSNPKTMDEIAKEAERETLTQLATPSPQSQRSSRDERDRDRERDRKRGRAGGVSDDGWTTAGGGGRITTPRGPVEINKLKVKSDIDVFGSKHQFTTWSKGSGGSKSKSDMIGSPATNPFTILSSSDSEKPGSSPLSSMKNLQMPMRDSVTSNSELGIKGSVKSASREGEVQKPNAIGAYSPAYAGQSSGHPNSRENSVLRDESAAPKSTVGSSPTTKSPEVLPEKDMQNKAELLIKEFLSSENTQDLILCVQEEIHASQLCEMVTCWFQLCLEWSSSSRTKTVNAVIILQKAGLLDTPCLLNALEEILTQADDLLIDIPMTYKYLAELIVPLMLNTECLTFSHVKEALDPLKASGGARTLLLEIVKILQKEMGPGWIVPRWKEADMSWSKYWPGDKVDQFLTENGLTYFLESKESENCTSLSQLPLMPFEEMQERLVKLMPQSSYDDMVKWISVNVGQEIRKTKYIRALMTAICEIATCQEKSQWKLNIELFNLHSKLIQRYVDHTELLELQALYAIQAFVTRLMHPSGLLTTILSNLLEECVLSRDSIQAWVKSQDPAEAEGRGVAIKSINQFLTWLDEPDYDSLDETP